MTESTLEWAKNLSNELKRWVPSHGYKKHTELANVLEIPQRNFRYIYNGEGIVGGNKRTIDGQIYYARINLWTDLEEADPRTIPPLLIRLPNGGTNLKQRNWSGDEYSKWLTSPEARELLDMKNDRLKRAVIELPLAEQQVESSTHQPSEVSETVGSFVGSIIDGVINRAARQVSNAMLEGQKDLYSTQISSLEDRIDSLERSINKLVVQPQADRVVSIQQSPRTGDVSQLANHLKNLLDRYKVGSSEDRDKLMQKYGKDLMALDIVVHTLTRLPLERERILDLVEDIKL